MKNALQTKTRIVEVIESGGDNFELILENTFTKPWAPGQFVMLSCQSSGDPFLKRPFSLYRETDSETDGCISRLHFLIKAVGKGTNMLKELKPSASLEMIGPLGNGFRAPEPGRRAVLVGGGIGIPPLVALGVSPLLQNVPITTCIGGRSKEDLLALDILESFSEELILSTDDGSMGHRGLVTKQLVEVIDRSKEPLAIYACGPDGMLRAVGRVALEREIPCQLSLEAHMACGYGVCLGCVVPSAEGSYVRVCRDGPVFEARDLVGYGSKENS